MLQGERSESRSPNVLLLSEAVVGRERVTFSHAFPYTLTNSNFKGFISRFYALAHQKEFTISITISINGSHVQGQHA